MKQFTPPGLHLLVQLPMACPSFIMLKILQIHVFTSLQWLFSLHQWLQNAQIDLGRLFLHQNWSKIDLPMHFSQRQLEKLHQMWRQALKLNLIKSLN